MKIQFFFTILMAFEIANAKTIFCMNEIAQKVELEVNETVLKDFPNEPIYINRIVIDGGRASGNMAMNGLRPQLSPILTYAAWVQIRIGDKEKSIQFRRFYATMDADEDCKLSNISITSNDSGKYD